MTIEKVVLETTLKAGRTIWEKGTILTSPLPPDIEREISAGTGTVRVVEGGTHPEGKLVFMTKRVEEPGTSTAAVMTKSAPKPSPIKQAKPKPKLRRRR